MPTTKHPPEVIRQALEGSIDRWKQRVDDLQKLIQDPDGENQDLEEPSDDLRPDLDDMLEDVPTVGECPLCRLFHYCEPVVLGGCTPRFHKEHSCVGCPINKATQGQQFCEGTPCAAYATLAEENDSKGMDLGAKVIALMAMKQLAEEEVTFLESLRPAVADAVIIDNPHL